MACIAFSSLLLSVVSCSTVLVAVRVWSVELAELSSDKGRSSVCCSGAGKALGVWDALNGNGRSAAPFAVVTVEDDELPKGRDRQLSFLAGLEANLSLSVAARQSRLAGIAESSGQSASLPFSRNAARMRCATRL